MDTAYLAKFDFAAANAPALADKLGLTAHEGLAMDPAVARDTTYVYFAGGCFTGREDDPMRIRA